MTNTVAQSDRLDWWLTSDQPDAVKAVLSLASLRDGDTDANHDAACKVYGAHADSVVDIAAQLDWIQRLDVEDPAEVMFAWHHVDRPYSVNDCEALRDELKADAVMAAQLVASVAQIGRAA